jgi:hypothetical protein
MGSIQYPDAHRCVICASGERHRRQPSDRLQDRDGRSAHTKIEPAFADRLRRGARRKLLADAIEYDRYPLSPRVQTLRRILAKFGP